jgi:hypothetical protein
LATSAVLHRASVKNQAGDQNYNSTRSSQNMIKHFYAYGMNTLDYISRKIEWQGEYCKIFKSEKQILIT